MRLYLSDAHLDLLKKAGPQGTPPAGVGNQAKSPGAVSGGQAPLMDCPLGAKCPDGGKHRMGTAIMAEHTKLAQKQAPSKKSDAEAQGGRTDKPGVTPDSANLGSLGSDAVQGRQDNKTLRTKLDPQEKRLRRNERRAKPTKEMDMSGVQEASAKDKTQAMDMGSIAGRTQEQPAVSPNGKTQAMDMESIAGRTQEQPAVSPNATRADSVTPVSTSEMQDATTRDTEIQTVPHPEQLASAPDTRATQRDLPEVAEVDAVNEPPGSQRRTIPMPARDKPAERRRQDVPNPMDPRNAPPDSKPLDHYKLARVARDSGDTSLAKRHEQLARERSSKMSSDEHRAFAEQLRAEGFKDAARHHQMIYDRVEHFKQQAAQRKAEGEASEKPQKLEATRQSQAEKARSDLVAAKKSHEDLKAKADKIRAENQKKLEAHEAAVSAYEKARSEGKKVKKPTKPKLQKEPKVPARPALVEPKTDAEKLRHESHQTKAGKLRESIESHLANNKDLSDDSRRQLERAHQIAAYHENMGHLPTGAHKEDLRTAEVAATEHGAAEAWTDPAKSTAEATESQQDAAEPERPTNPMSQMRVTAHTNKAKELKANILSHLEDNPNLSPEDKAHAETVLNALSQHEKLGTVPTDDQAKELKEIHNLAGPLAKPAKDSTKPEARDTARASGSVGDLVSKFHAGRAMGAGMAQSAVSPYGAAGHLASQTVNYGLQGATSAGHTLLREKEKGDTDQRRMDKEKAKQEAAEKKQEKQIERKNRPNERGLAGGVG